MYSFVVAVDDSNDRALALGAIISRLEAFGKIDGLVGGGASICAALILGPSPIG